MNRALWRGFGVTIVMLVATFVSGQTSPAPQTDTQIWNDVQFSVSLGKTVDFTLLGGLRFGRHVSRPVDERLGVAFSFKAGNYLTFTPSYLNIGIHPYEGRIVFENLLSLSRPLRSPLHPLTL